MRLALDPVGGETLGRLAATLERGGTAVLFGRMSDDPVQLDVNPIIFNDVRVRGFWLLPWLQSSTAETQGEVYGELTQEIIAGRLHAAVSARYSLEELQKAIAATEAIGRKGKVLFAPNGV